MTTEPKVGPELDKAVADALEMNYYAQPNDQSLIELDNFNILYRNVSRDWSEAVRLFRDVWNMEDSPLKVLLQHGTVHEVIYFNALMESAEAICRLILAACAEAGKDGDDG